MLLLFWIKVSWFEGGDFFYFFIRVFCYFIEIILGILFVVCDSYFDILKMLEWFFKYVFNIFIEVYVSVKLFGI